MVIDNFYAKKINFNFHFVINIYENLKNIEFLKFIFIGFVGFINVQFFKIFIYDADSDLSNVYLNYEFIQRFIWFISGLVTVYYTKYVFKNKQNPNSISVKYFLISFIFLIAYYIFNSQLISLFFDDTYVLNNKIYLIIMLISSILVAYIPILDTYLNAIKNFSKMLFIYVIVLIFTIIISYFFLSYFELDKIISFCLAQSFSVLLACIYYRLSKN